MANENMAEDVVSMMMRGLIRPFNGGKMNHIWTPGPGYYESTFANEAAERCFHNPRTMISLKVHGECALLLKTLRTNHNNNNNKVSDDFDQDVTATAADNDDRNRDNAAEPATSLYEWTFWTRYDSHGKKDPPPGAIPLPVYDDNDDNAIQPAVYQDHHYWLVPLDRNFVTGKGKRQTLVGPDTYGAIAAGVASGDIPDANDPNAPPYISVEWIGQKHQGNIDQCTTADHAICLHGQVVLNHWFPLPQRSRHQIETLATTTLSIEGLVLYDPDTGERFKIRFDMFPNSLFARRQRNNTKTTIPTIETTSIKPKAIVAIK
jgi:hypothetical protein